MRRRPSQLALGSAASAPSGLVSTLGGSGSVTLGTSRITQISAPKLKLAMEKALNAEPDKLGMVLKSEVNQDMEGSMGMMGMKIPMSIDQKITVAPY